MMPRTTRNDTKHNNLPRKRPDKQLQQQDYWYISPPGKIMF